MWRIAGAPVVVDAGEGVRRRGGANRVDRDLDVAVGAVLEADRHREAGAELAVDLALGRARADRPPGDGVGDVLRRDRVEELAADRQAEVEHLEQQRARDAQAGVDVAGAVEVGIVDQALPAGRRPRLLEVDPHRDQQVLAQLLARRRRAGRRSRAPPPSRGRCRARPRPAAGRRCRPARCRLRRGRAPPPARAPRRAAGPRAASPAGPARRSARSADRGPGRGASPCIPIIILPSPFSTLESYFLAASRGVARAA